LADASAAGDLELIDVRTALALAGYIDEALSFQLLNIFVGRLPANADVIGKPLLTGNAMDAVMNVSQEDRKKIND